MAKILLFGTEGAQIESSFTCYVAGDCKCLDDVIWSATFSFPLSVPFPSPPGERSKHQPTCSARYTNAYLVVL
ncbi:hypothetical protein TNCV_2494061 [Trichonephila clavipes]|uniref:Uncharacterized protein n=1 Tax=Trichonephila clavipes TaxID=2585209 RepID=A0A8X6RZB4_TRICX|nr:hypothetical protein TNCV_2494061 [Trichonephila clavipes]